MNSLALALLLGTIASSPFLAFGLANAAPSATRRQDTVIRRSLIFALCLGLLTLAGNWAGRVMTGLLEPGQQWLIDTLWYVVALKMIFVSFRRHPNYVGVDTGTTGSALLAGIATSTDGLLMALALGLEQQDAGSFTVYSAGLAFVFVLLGSGPLASLQALKRNHPRILLVSGSLLLIITALT